MLNWKTSRLRQENGDTLIEVTFALAILGFVILSCTALMTSAFRTGQTARERTQVSEVAQEQMEALRSFRDNHTWNEFQNGSVGYGGINAVASGFHMALMNTGLGNEWVPVGGALTSGGSSPLQVPTASIVLSTATVAPTNLCGYDFLLNYSFTPIGSSNPTGAHGQIKTQLVNLKFSGGTPCP